MSARALIAILLCLPATALARPPVYVDEVAASFLSISYLDYQSSDLDSNAGEIGGERSLFDAQYQSDAAGWRVGLGHEYDALDIQLSGAEPQANGDLHTLHLTGALELPQQSGPLTLTLAPAISTSSNAMKDPGEWTSDTLQIWAAALWQPTGEHWDWVPGIAHDYRWGQSRVYPVAGITGTYRQISYWATWPDLSIAWDIDERWLLEFDLSPDGNEWYAFDRDLDNGDEFRREAWQGDLQISYQAFGGLRLGVSAGYQFDQAWRIRLRDGEWLRVDGVGVVGVHVGWVWR